MKTALQRKPASPAAAFPRGVVLRAGLLGALALGLAACQAGIDDVFPKAERPIPDHLVNKMKSMGMTAASPIMMRIYKTENVLEVWKQRDNGRFALLSTYEICKWSGKLGPKFKEGDRQAPEGFYKVAVHQLNPRSEYHLSFNLGFPNTFDRAHGRTGSHLMVHGACSSAGCYSMEDDQVEEIYALARDALKGGQEFFQVQAFPFRMTAENLASHVTNPHFDFWKSLKEGYDHFEITNYPPKVDVCEKRYVFNREAVDDAEFMSREACPPLTMPARLLEAYKERLKEEQAEFAKALKRNRLRNAPRDAAWASLDVDRISIVAPGSEVLPPPTPVEQPEAPVAEPGADPVENAPVVAAAPQDETPPADSGSVAEPPQASTPEEITAAIAAVPPSQTDEASASQATADGATPAIPEIVPVPTQPNREAVAAQPVQTERKKPWWQRTGSGS